LFILTDKGTVAQIDLFEDCKETLLTTQAEDVVLAEISKSGEGHLVGITLGGTFVDLTTNETLTLLSECTWTSIAPMSTSILVSGWNSTKKVHIVQVLTLSPQARLLQACQYSVATANFPSFHLVALPDRPLLLSSRLYSVLDVLHYNKNNHKVSLLASRTIRDLPASPDSLLYSLTLIAPKKLFLGLRGAISELSF